MKGAEEAALSKTAAPRHKNNKRRRWRRGRGLRSHTDGEIFHVSRPLTFKWAARHCSGLELPLSGSSYQRCVLGRLTLLMPSALHWGGGGLELCGVILVTHPSVFIVLRSSLGLKAWDQLLVSVV